MNLFQRFPWFHWGYPYIICWAILVHIVWGIGLWANDQVAVVVLLIGLNHFIDDLHLSPELLGSILIAASLAAGWGLMHEGIYKSRAVLAWLLPQYFLMLIALLSDAWVLINGLNSASGTPINRMVLLTILGPVMIAAFLHTLSIVERFVIEPRRDD